MKNVHRARQLQVPVHFVSTLKRGLRTRTFKAIMLILILTMSIMPVTKDVHGAPALQASTLTFTTEADARVHENSPNSNYGSANYMLVDGVNNPDVESFLRFT